MDELHQRQKIIAQLIEARLEQGIKLKKFFNGTKT